MNDSNDNIRIVIPLTIRQRNGRPKILPPDDVLEQQSRVQAPHILKALGRAWAWRRRIDNGEASTAGEIAKAEGITERFVSRTMRLAYLSPEIIERLVIGRKPPAESWNDLVGATYLPWSQQADRVFTNRCT